MTWENIAKKIFVISIYCVTFFSLITGDESLRSKIIAYALPTLALYYFVVYLASDNYIPATDIIMAFFMCFFWFFHAYYDIWENGTNFIVSVLFFIYLLAINIIKYIAWGLSESANRQSGVNTCALLDPQRLDEALALVGEGSLAEYSEKGEAEFMSDTSRDTISESLSEGSISIWTCEDDGKLVGVLGARPGHISFMSISKDYYRNAIAWRLMAKMNEHFGEADTTVNSSPDAVMIYINLGFSAMGDEQTINGIRFIPMKRQAGARLS